MPARRAGADRAASVRLQRAITAQCEQVERDRLHALFAALPVEDHRRRAWFSADRCSSQLVTARPEHTFDCTRAEFREMYTTYFGAHSPVCIPLVGRALPTARPSFLDAHGFVLDSAVMPVATFTACHNAVRDFFYDLSVESGVLTRWEPRSIFTTLIPPAVLLSPGRPPGVVPDLEITVPMPVAHTARVPAGGQRPPRVMMAERALLWDVKTIHGDSLGYYLCPRARDEQSGAVAQRAHLVWPAYRRHAHALDSRYHPAGTPVEDRLSSYSQTRALVVGQYAEASPDVHDLIEELARRQARAQWRLFGARREEEARSFFVATIRRRTGLFVAREMARHRLRRIPLVGVSRHMALQWEARPPPRVGGDIAQIGASDFHAFQAFHAVARPVGVP